MVSGNSHGDGLPLDVLLVCAGLGAGGTQRVVANLAAGLSDLGHRVVVATFYDGAPDFFHLPASVPRVRMRVTPLAPVVRTAQRRLRRRMTRAARAMPSRAQDLLQARATTWALVAYMRRLARVRWIRRTIADQRPATVVSFGPGANVSALVAAEGLPCRLVISERNDLERQLLDFPVTTLRRRLYPNADVVTANSHGTLAALEAWVPADKLRFAPNPLAIPPDARTGSPPPGFSGPCVLNVARLVGQKDHDVLLAAVARLPAALDHWRLAIVGTGPLEGTLRARAEGLGINHRLDWYGASDDPYAFYRHAAIFALPSRFEGMPNALLEAMSFGVPPIVSDGSAGPLELVRHGETGLVVPTGDSDALASAIARLATQPDLRRRLGQAARQETARFETGRAMAAWVDVLGLPRRSVAAADKAVP